MLGKLNIIDFGGVEKSSTELDIFVVFIIFFDKCLIWGIDAESDSRATFFGLMLTAFNVRYLIQRQFHDSIGV